MNEITVTSDNFTSEVLESDKPVLIDFWAPWCGPCRMIGPAVSEIAQQYADSVKVGKVNIDEEPALAMKYGISAIPALIMFRNGQPAEKIVGLVPKEEIEKIL